MRGSPVYIEIGATLSRIQEPGVSGELIGCRETVDGPGLSTRPTRIVAPSLVRCLLKKLAGFDIKSPSCEALPSPRIRKRRVVMQWSTATCTKDASLVCCAA